MQLVEDGLDFALPRMVPVEQIFPARREASIAGAVAREFARPGTGDRIRPGMRIGIGVGSRGLADLQAMVRGCVEEVRRRGGHPVIIPAMGSHGGATPEGQAELLARYGITPEQVGAPVEPDMDTRQIGPTPEGIPVWCSTVALGMDGLVPVARIKPHTDFHGPIESGICKMLAIGFGKHRGASTLHKQGFERFHTVIPDAARAVLARAPVLFGLAAIENAYDQVAQIEAVPADQVMDREPQLLDLAREAMGRIKFPEFDVLIVGEIGKDISGAGMDPNVTGRYEVPFLSGEPRVQKLVALGLTGKTHGNAIGVGMADIITRRLADRIDFTQTYINAITSTLLTGVRVPLTMPTDRDAIALAVRLCNRVEPADARIVYIRNTLQLRRIHVSEPLWREHRHRADLRPTGPAGELRFDAEGRMLPPKEELAHG